MSDEKRRTRFEKLILVVNGLDIEMQGLNKTLQATINKREFLAANIAEINSELAKLNEKLTILEAAHNLLTTEIKAISQKER